MNNSGVVHFVAENDVEAIKICKRLLSFLAVEQPWKTRRGGTPTSATCATSRSNRIVPDEAKLPYDMREIITRIVDRGDFLEVQKEFARNVVVGFGRMRGPHRWA